MYPCIIMLSVLIPIYNYDVVKLVDTLQKQCSKLKIAYEILCFDDGSTGEFKRINSQVAGYFAVNYTELSQNLGRAKIRNWLAKSASYDNLLFLDCDSKVSGRNFVKKYISEIGKADIISGGRSYTKSPPRAKSKKLHWLFGVHRESKSAKFRNKHPYLFFHSNNFLVKKSLISKIKFDESVKGYGYEDLLFGQRLKDEGILARHIDNPIQHLGLEKSQHFLKKTSQAIDNLLILKYSGKGIETRLEKAANRLQDLGFHEDFLKIYKWREKSIEKNLLSNNPRIRNLDFYKLNYYLVKRREWIDRKNSN